jgi:SAM-dependent methyltransferase
MIDPNWHEQFFRGLAVEFWNLAMPPEQTELEIEFLLRQTPLAAGQRVLDLPCGAGRHALALTHRGVSVTAVDGSREMLELARRHAAQQQLHVEFTQADMRAFRSSQRFDGAISLGNSFGYVERNGLSQFLDRIYQSLKPGGWFVFDYGAAAESLLPRFEPEQSTEVGGILFSERNHYHARLGGVETHYRFERGGLVEECTGWQTVMTVRAVIDLLAECGFQVVSTFGSWDGARFELAAPILIVLATRQDGTTSSSC